MCYTTLLATCVSVMYSNIMQSISTDEFANVIFVPSVIVVFVNCAAFAVCCLSDPGWITTKNFDKIFQLYKIDGILYKSGNKCPTCKLQKPSRSKHCCTYSQVKLSNCKDSVLLVLPNVRYFI